MTNHASAREVPRRKGLHRWPYGMGRRANPRVLSACTACRAEGADFRHPGPRLCERYRGSARRRGRGQSDGWPPAGYALRGLRGRHGHLVAAWRGAGEWWALDGRAPGLAARPARVRRCAAGCSTRRADIEGRNCRHRTYWAQPRHCAHAGRGRTTRWGPSRRASARTEREHGCLDAPAAGARRAGWQAAQEPLDPAIALRCSAITPRSRPSGRDAVQGYERMSCPDAVVARRGVACCRTNGPGQTSAAARPAA